MAQLPIRRLDNAVATSHPREGWSSQCVLLATEQRAAPQALTGQQRARPRSGDPRERKPARARHLPAGGHRARGLLTCCLFSLSQLAQWNPRPRARCKQTRRSRRSDLPAQSDRRGAQLEEDRPGDDTHLPSPGDRPQAHPPARLDSRLGPGTRWPSHCRAAPWSRTRTWL